MGTARVDGRSSEGKSRLARQFGSLARVRVAVQDIYRASTIDIPYGVVGVATDLNGRDLSMCDPTSMCSTRLGSKSEMRSLWRAALRRDEQWRFLAAPTAPPLLFKVVIPSDEPSASPSIGRFVALNGIAFRAWSFGKSRVRMSHRCPPWRRFRCIRLLR